MSLNPCHGVNIGKLLPSLKQQKGRRNETILSITCKNVSCYYSSLFFVVWKEGLGKKIGCPFLVGGAAVEGVMGLPEWGRRSSTEGLGQSSQSVFEKSLSCMQTAQHSFILIDI
jgi:hypothetical protein